MLSTRGQAYRICERERFCAASSPNERPPTPAELYYETALVLVVSLSLALLVEMSFAAGFVHPS